MHCNALSCLRPEKWHRVFAKLGFALSLPSTLCKKRISNFIWEKWTLYKKQHWITEKWSFLEMARSQATCSLHLQSESFEHRSRVACCNILEHKGRICSSSLPEDEKSFLDLHSAPFSFPSRETAHSPVWLKGLPFLCLAWPVSCLLAGHSYISVSSMFWTKT